MIREINRGGNLSSDIARMLLYLEQPVEINARANGLAGVSSSPGRRFWDEDSWPTSKSREVTERPCAAVDRHQLLADRSERSVSFPGCHDANLDTTDASGENIYVRRSSDTFLMTLSLSLSLSLSTNLCAFL